MYQSRTKFYNYIFAILISLHACALMAMDEPKTLARKAAVKCDLLQRNFRQDIFENLPLAKHLLNDIDNDQITAFKKKYLKTYGFVTIFNDSYEKTYEYLTKVWAQPTSQEILKKTIDFFSTKNNVTLAPEEIKTLISNYCIENFLQKFYVPASNHSLWSCKCSKAPVAAKLLCSLNVAMKLPQFFSPDQCTESNPLVSTFFGPGRLMSEYLLLHALSKYYQFLTVNCIDKAYANDESYLLHFSVLREQLARANVKAKMFIFSSTALFHNHIATTQRPQNLIVAIDPGDKKKINEHKKAVRRATIAHISLLSYAFNTKHTIIIKFPDPAQLKAKSYNGRILQSEDHVPPTKTMETQCKHLDTTLIKHFIGKSHESRETIVEELTTFIQKKKRKLRGKNSEDSYNLLDVEWYKHPRTEFEDFVRPYHKPSALIMMIYNGVKEFSTSKV